MSNLYLSPKHGVNPSLSICFWCGKEKNEIYLLGRMKGDATAPMHAVFDYEPCDACKAIMAQGITFAESINGKTPTGRFFVLKKEAAIRILTEDFTGVDIDKVISFGKVYFEPEVFNMLVLEEDPNISQED